MKKGKKGLVLGIIFFMLVSTSSFAVGSDFQQIDSKPVSVSNKRISEIVILAPNSSFFSTVACQAYVAHRQAQGFTFRFETIEHLVSPDATMVRDVLKNNYTDGFRRNLLIFGDENLIPCQYCYQNVINPTVPVHSDYYYGDLEGDWNKNNDEFFGEYLVDDVDFLDPEFFVGRLPGKNVGEVDEILNRIVLYETMSDSWKKNMLCAAGSVEFKGDASLAMFRIHNILSRRFYPITTMTDHGFFKFIKPDTVLNETSFRDTWKNGQFGFIYTISHGSSIGLQYAHGWNVFEYFRINDVEDLNPSFPGVYISLGCNNNQQYCGDTLGKELIKKRMAAVVASTTITFPGYYGVTGVWAESFFPRMYLLRNFDLGKSMHITKSLYCRFLLGLTKDFDIGKRMHTNLLAFTVYGDPLIKQF